MSYEEDYRKPYSSPCACGKGILRYYRIVESNDWGQERESSTPVEILCDFCKSHYHYEKYPHFGKGLLVPNELSIPPEIPRLDYKQQYSTDEEFIGEHDKEDIEAMIADMTAPKHRFIKDLTYEPARRYAEEWALLYKKKSLDPMIDHLRCILSHYDELTASREKKKPYIEEHRKQTAERGRAARKVEEQSFRPLFKYDSDQDKLDHERARKEQNEYKETHKYDSFDARVTYHDSCRVDSTGCYWDSLHILECVDPQYLVLDKPQYGSANITIVKKYRCKCTICGKETEALSSQFEIRFDVDSNRFYPALQCDCHTVSSFEAKAMDILNGLGISYEREVSFDGLAGDYGHSLRFDFALFSPDSCDSDGNREIRLLLELQGPHHYKQGKYDEYGDFIEDKENASLSAKARSEKQIRYDGLKQQYCADHGIALEQIKYTGSSYDKLEERITGILKKYGFDDNRDDLPF